LSDFDDFMSGVGVDEDFAESEEYEAAPAAWAAHTEISVESAVSAQETRDRIRSIVSDEFIVEAISSATMLRHMLGSSDGVVAESCTNIEQNLSVLALSIKKDPVGFLLSFARAMDTDSERVEWVQSIIERLVNYINQIQ
jgi:hypothetical protein